MIVAAAILALGWHSKPPTHSIVAAIGCETRLVKIVTASDDFQEYAVEPAALTRKCLPVTRRLVLLNYDSGKNVRAKLAFDSVIDAELKFGVEDISRGKVASGESLWRAAIADQHTAHPANPFDDPTVAVPNPGLRLIATGNFAKGFAWFHLQYTQWKVGEDPHLTDSGYYDFLVAGLLAGSEGRYSAAKAFFEKCLQLFPNGSDASLYLGMSELALRNEALAKKAWTESITRRAMAQNSVPPGYWPQFGVSSAYLWLTLFEAGHRARNVSQRTPI
jgi:tetratricopeptide (TPR) repeat protein